MGLLAGIVSSVGGLTGVLSTVGGFLGKLITGKMGKDKDLALAQAEITKAEIANAPQSKLLLWRPFFGWVMVTAFVVLFIWMLMSVFFPELKSEIVNDLFKFVTQILLGLIGFGF